MNMTMNTPDGERNKMNDNVLSWIENELQCVTTQRISQSLDVSRPEAAKLLDDILQTKNDNARFQITTCQQVKEGTATVFRLRHTTTATDVEQQPSTAVFALSSLEATESVSTAHERDMVQLREMIADGQTLACTGDKCIVAADEVSSMKDQKPDKRQVIANTQSSSFTGGKNGGRQQPFAGKAKAVTAASFFGNQGPKKASKPTAANASDKSKLSQTSTTSSSITTNKQPAPSIAKENKGSNSQGSASSKRPSTKTKVGNADDFVADEEDSDDEVQHEVVHTKKPVQRRRAREVPAVTSHDNDDEDPTPTVHGAMDDFATRKTAPPPSGPTRQRKRRRKLVEKTVSVNGYIQTRTEEVWEDIPTDEEEEEKKAQIARSSKLAANRKPQLTSTAKKPQAMKQKSLKGFFAMPRSK